MAKRENEMDKETRKNVIGAIWIDAKPLINWTEVKKIGKKYKSQGYEFARGRWGLKMPKNSNFIIFVFRWEKSGKNRKEHEVKIEYPTKIMKDIQQYFGLEDHEIPNLLNKGIEYGDWR